jgi:hypothetical protein
MPFRLFRKSKSPKSSVRPMKSLPIERQIEEEKRVFPYLFRTRSAPADVPPEDPNVRIVREKLHFQGKLRVFFAYSEHEVTFAFADPKDAEAFAKMCLDKQVKLEVKEATIFASPGSKIVDVMASYVATVQHMKEKDNTEILYEVVVQKSVKPYSLRNFEKYVEELSRDYGPLQRVSF